VPSMPMPGIVAKYLLHRHYVFCETDQEAVNKAKLYAYGHDVELWEGTRAATCLLNSVGFLLLRARRRQAVCLGTINGRGGYVHVPGPRRHLCV
jgi:hypothetical protein